MKQWTESKKEMLFLDVFGKSLPAWWHIAIVVDRHPAWILLVHIQLFPGIDLIWSDPRTQKLTAEKKGTQPLFLEMEKAIWIKWIPVSAKVPSCKSLSLPLVHILLYMHTHANKQTNERTDGQTNIQVDGIGFSFQHHSMDSPPRRWEWRWIWTIFLHLNGNWKETVKRSISTTIVNWPRPWRWVKWRTFLVMGIFQRERRNPIWEWENPWTWHSTASFMWHHLINHLPGRFWIQASLPLLLHQTHLSQKWVGCPCGHLRCIRCR